MLDDASSRLTRGFLLTHVALPAALLSAALVLVASTNADRHTADLFFDPASGRFTAGNAAGALTLVHDGGRDLIALATVACLATFGLSFVSQRAARLRWRAAYVAACILLTTGTVALWKSRSALPCPWSYDRWGGDLPFTDTFAPVLAGTPAGECFPSGHSSGAWALWSLYFAARAGPVRQALAWLWPGTAVGLSFSLVQWARGAHFPSHDLVSAAVAWACCVLLYSVLGRRMAAEAVTVR